MYQHIGIWRVKMKPIVKYIGNGEYILFDKYGEGVCVCPRCMVEGFISKFRKKYFKDKQ